MPHGTEHHNAERHNADAHGSEPHGTFGSQWWEQHYQDGDPDLAGEPSSYLLSELAGLVPGSALDAGCGTGADATWLASRGWDVTAVDISATAIERARAVTGRDAPKAGIAWVVADVATWTAPQQYDLVVSHYVHPDSPFDHFVARLAGAVAPGGTLLVVGHDHADSHSSVHAPGDAAMGAALVTGALDPEYWTVQVAETRTRQARRGAQELTLVDTVVKALRTG